MSGSREDEAAMNPEALPERKTLNGKFSAYCRVCWNPVYVLWIDDEDHEGKCQFGHIRAHECPDALERARTAATVQKLKAAGLVA